MSKKKILVFIDWFYPAYKAGGPVRSCMNLIEKLGKDFEFRVVTSDREYQESEPMKGIATDSWVTHPTGFVVKYLSSPSPDVIKKILQEEKPDLIWLNSMFSKDFSIIPLRLWKGKVILSPRGMLAEEALRLKKTKKAVFLKLAGIFGWHKQVIFHATSEQEKLQIGKMFPNNEIRLAPNIPTPSFPLGKRPGKVPGKIQFVSLGRIAPEKNLFFILDLLLKLSRELKPDQLVIFDHFGPVYDTDYLRLCQELIRKMSGRVEVNIKGSLPAEEVHATLQAYQFFLFPSRSENYGHAIVQAWGAGLPVLTSDATPWRRLAEEGTGWDISNADRERWMEVLRKCFEMNDSDYRSLSQSAKAKADKLSGDTAVLVLSKNLFS